MENNGELRKYICLFESIFSSPLFGANPEKRFLEKKVLRIRF
jgi:hypothetical protein